MERLLPSCLWIFSLFLFGIDSSSLVLAFHNFPHANHVTMSVVKLLSRIQAPDVEEVGVQTLHDHTYGITSDPLTRFSVVLAALIHDVDHMVSDDGSNKTTAWSSQ